MTSQDDHQLRIDPISGTPVFVAPKRKARPILTTQDKASSACPFCTGSEGETPPETDAIRRDGSAPNTPGWTVRAFPNKFAAWHHHEVLAEGPDHGEQPSSLGMDLWGDVLQLAARRCLAMEDDPEVEVAFWFRNVGREAGASIRHNHSQIMGMPQLPPRLATPLRRWQEGADGGALGAAAERAADDGRTVWQDERFAVFSPEVPKLPFETWIAPFDTATDGDPFDPAIRPHVAAALQKLCEAIDRAFHGPAFNIWLHRVPGTGFPWSLQAQPRTGFLAGLELGGGMTINATDSRTAAASLREALAKNSG